MGSVNRITVVGNLGDKPELRSTTGGKAVGNFSVATNHSYKKDGGEQVEQTEWHRIVVWGALAETCSKYLEQGSTVYVEGRMTYREYQDKDGKERLSAEIIASDVQFLSKRKADTKQTSTSEAEA
ncbi:MAG: single-stranded DNA-binding protein [Archangium sp.]